MKIRLNEAQLKKIVAESVKTVLNELNAQTLQKAADVADYKGRFKQRDRLLAGAKEKVGKDFPARNDMEVDAQRLNYKSVGGTVTISRNGNYYYRPKDGYNCCQGNIKGGISNPGMKVDDKTLARLIVKWWQMYKTPDASGLEDWHEIANL